MPPIDCTLDGHLALLTLRADENRFNPDFLSALLAMLDHVERESDASTLLVTSAHEKIFCNGIDLEWLLAVQHAKDTAAAKAFFYQLNAVFRRLLTYPLISVAAINGHAFAGGAILACCFDFRLMRTDRGFFCLPEVDLGIPFLPGMNAILAKAIPRHRLDEMQLTGRRLTAEDCLADHIVSRACTGTQLIAEAMEFCRPLAKSRPVVAELKRRLNQPILAAIDQEDPPYIESGQFRIG
jgi:enoyl-CoA hydratase/carnithine racemase